jgi:hypothetical protein
MRKSALLTLLALGAIAALAATAFTGFPRLLHYQGVVKDGNGILINNPNVSLEYRLYDVAINGAFFWAEVTQVAVTDGQVDHLLGSVTALPDTAFTKFDSIWLELIVAGEALTPRILMTPSAYSMRVETIDKATGGDVFGDVWIHSDLTVGDLSGSNGRILVYDGLAPRIFISGDEILGDGPAISVTNTSSQSAVKIDGQDAEGIAHIMLYHNNDQTMDLAASVDDTLGSQIRMFTLPGVKTIEIDAEYPGSAGIGGGPGIIPEGRIGVNVDPDSAAVQAHSSNQYTAYFTNNEAPGSSFPVVVKGLYTGVASGIGMWGEGYPSEGNGTGGFFRGGEHGVTAIAEGGDATYSVSGIEAFSYGSNNNGDRHGVYGVAQGGQVAHGVYGFANQGGTNWGGYFAGDSYMASLAIGTDFLVATNTNAPPPAGYKLAVNGKVICEEVEVILSEDWPDYVFEENYDLMPLPDVEAAIRAEGHLPGVPSAQEIADGGVALGAMQAKLMEKVEELTLHMIALNKDLKEVRRENKELRSLLGVGSAAEGVQP